MLLWQQNLQIETGYTNETFIQLQWPIQVRQTK